MVLQLLLLVCVINTLNPMDTKAQDVCAIGHAGTASANITLAALASDTNIYSPLQTRLKKQIIHDDISKDLIQSNIQITSSTPAVRAPQSSHQCICYTLHPEQPMYTRSAVIEKLSDDTTNGYWPISQRIDYFCGEEHAVNDSDQYLKKVQHKSLDKKSIIYNRFCSVLDDIVVYGTYAARFGKDHPVLKSSLRRRNQVGMLAKQIDYYHRFPTYPALVKMTRRNWMYFHDTVLKELVLPASAAIIESHDENASTRSYFTKKNWTYFHDRVLRELVATQCAKMIQQIELEEDVPQVICQWRKKMPDYAPRFSNYYDRLNYWHNTQYRLYFKDRVLKELLAKHALRIIARYRTRKDSPMGNASQQTSSAPTLIASDIAPSQA